MARLVLKNILIRLGYLAISLLISRIAYTTIYAGYMSYLPNQSILDKLNSIASELNAFRRQYTDAYEHSMIASFLVFLLCFISLEYFHKVIHQRLKSERDYEKVGI